MADIFLSYAHEDQPAAKRIVDALAREGLDAWWDHELRPGQTWAGAIGERVRAAKIVIVLWSSRSVGSNFVQEEAQLALDAGKLLPVKVDDVEPPMGFRRLHAANLVGWRGDAAHRQWNVLLSEIRDRLGHAPAAPSRAAPPPPPPPPAPQPNRMPIFIGAGAIIAAVVIGLFLMTRGPNTVAENENATTTDTAIEQATTGQTDMGEGPREEAGEAIDGAQKSSSPPQTDARTIELQFWRSCCDHQGAAIMDYRSYLTRYPSGEFAAIARRRIADLTPAATRAPSVAGTVWYGRNTRTSGDGGTVNWRFEEGGATYYSFNDHEYPTQRTSYSWTQNGDEIRVAVPNSQDYYAGRISGNSLTMTHPDGTQFAGTRR